MQRCLLTCVDVSVDVFVDVSCQTWFTQRRKVQLRAVALTLGRSDGYTQLFALPHC